jgi:predicted nucleotidyltransferase
VNPIQKEFTPLIDPFVKKIKEVKPRCLKAVILYGSIARGEGHPSYSDIDVCLLFEGDYASDLRKIEEIAREISYDHFLRSGRKRIIPFRFLDIKTGELPTGDAHLIREIFREGIWLYNRGFKLGPKHLGLKPYVLFRVRFGDMEPRRKAKIWQALFGKRGSVKTFGGIVLGGGIFLIGQDEAVRFKELLEDWEMKYETIDLWLEK